VEGIRRIGEGGGPETVRFGFVEMRMEHDMRAALCGPADSLRIAPSFMADRDSEGNRTSVENVTPEAGTIEAIL